MFTQILTHRIYSGNMENHPQWAGHFMIHTEYFTFNILTLQEHTLCIECKLARHSSRIVKYAIMLFATFRSLNTLRGIIAYRPHITGHMSVSTLSFPILSFRLWWLTYSAGFSTWAKITPKMPWADRQDIFQINSTGTTRCSWTKKWSSWEGVTWQQVSNWDEEAGSVRQTAISLSSTVVDRQDTSLMAPDAQLLQNVSNTAVNEPWAVIIRVSNWQEEGFIRQPAIFLSQNVFNTTVNESLLS